MKNDKELNVSPSLSEEEKFILELKADIKQAKEEYLAGDFITHEEMLIELEKNGILKRKD
ncbi:hypothetical protein [Flavobacterium ustbae]|uniref:hypothetical protein n=1 Tax=Flavobacterium ustbae TaxID=2488790 RepID=UPI000F78510B|nr:hypothetical protein [Flavobacterium ustbae]